MFLEVSQKVISNIIGNLPNYRVIITSNYQSVITHLNPNAITAHTFLLNRSHLEKTFLFMLTNESAKKAFVTIILFKSLSAHQ
jgi:hypothetical protein